MSNEDEDNDTSKSIQVITLNNGVQMPRYGQGCTHQQGGYDSRAILTSLKLGVRLFDTAKRYGNEAELGSDLRASGVPREELFLTSKLWPSDADDPVSACQRSCAALGVEQLDLYLVHWPGSFGQTLYGKAAKLHRQRTWRGMEKVLELGLARAIGVSNHKEHHLLDVLETAKVAPAVNQIELNPFQNPRSLLELCRANKVVVEAWGPFAKGGILQHPTILTISTKHSRPPSQVLIRWCLQQPNTVCIPKSNNPEHLASNREGAFGWNLDEEDMDKLGELHCDLRCSWDPDCVP